MNTHWFGRSTELPHGPWSNPPNPLLQDMAAEAYDLWAKRRADYGLDVQRRIHNAQLWRSIGTVVFTVAALGGGIPLCLAWFDGVASPAWAYGAVIAVVLVVVLLAHWDIEGGIADSETAMAKNWFWQRDEEWSKEFGAARQAIFEERNRAADARMAQQQLRGAIAAREEATRQEEERKRAAARAVKAASARAEARARAEAETQDRARGEVEARAQAEATATREREEREAFIERVREAERQREQDTARKRCEDEREAKAQRKELLDASKPSDLMRNVMRMTGSEFEELVAERLRRDGVADAAVSGGAGDRGADVVGETAGGERVVVQCKRYRRDTKITSVQMQQFAGMVRTQHVADFAIYATTSSFTKEAERIGRSEGMYLLTYEQLEEWLGSDQLIWETAIPPL